MAHQAKTLSDNSSVNNFSDNNNKNVPLEQNGNNYNAKIFDNESISDEKQSWFERLVLFLKK